MSTDNLNAETFDIIAFIEGSNFPEKEVTVYTNGKAALQLRDALAADSDANKIEALREEVRASGITFKLRGLAPKVIEVMMSKSQVNSKNLTEEERLDRFLESTDTLLAATIVAAKTADGRVDSQAWTPERAKALRGALIGSEYEKLSEGVATVNFDAKLFDDSVDAGFPG